DRNREVGNADPRDRQRRISRRGNRGSTRTGRIVLSLEMRRTITGRRLIPGGLLMATLLGCAILSCIAATNTNFGEDASTAPAAATTVTTVRPSEIDDILYNPGMGFADFHFEIGSPLPLGQHPRSTVAYVQLVSGVEVDGPQLSGRRRRDVFPVSRLAGARRRPLRSPVQPEAISGVTRVLLARDEVAADPTRLGTTLEAMESRTARRAVGEVPAPTRSGMA